MSAAQCGLSSKLHAVRSGAGWPVLMLLTEGQIDDHKGAALLLDALPPSRERLPTASMTATFTR